MICPCTSTPRARSSWRWWGRAVRTRCRCNTWWGSCSTSKASCRPTPPTRWRWPSPTPTCAPVRSVWAWARVKPGAGSDEGGDSGRGERIVIGRLKGILIHKQPPWLVVDVGGVGYELEAPMSTFYDLPAVGGDVSLFTHYAPKEDSVSLYGFLSEPERRLFRDVQRVRDRKSTRLNSSH